MVSILWAILIDVLLIIIRSSEFCTFVSFLLSRADVASSRRRIVGYLNITRAIATLCFCPPEMCEPFTPTFLLNPLFYRICCSYFLITLALLICSFSTIASSIFSIYGLKLESFAAWTIYSWVAFYLLYLMLFSIVSLNSTGSWLTTPKHDRK